MRLTVFLVGFAAASLAASHAHAYVGPGAGIGALGAVLGIVAVIFLSVLAIALWPLRKMLRRRSKARPDHATAGRKR